MKRSRAVLPLKENLQVIGEEDVVSPKTRSIPLYQRIHLKKEAKERRQANELKSAPNARKESPQRRERTKEANSLVIDNRRSTITDAHTVEADLPRKGSARTLLRYQGHRIRKGVVFRDEDFESKKRSGIIIYN